MANEWFDEQHYIAQKVMQMNATGYTGKTGTAGMTWTAESAEAELAASGYTWLENFKVCNEDGYAASITVADINVSPNQLFSIGEYAQAVASYYNGQSFQGKTDWNANSVIDYLLNTEHTSLWEHYTSTGAKLGLNPSNDFDTSNWVDDQAAATGKTAEAILDDLAANGGNPLTAYFEGGGTVENAPAVPVEEQVVRPENFNPWYVQPGPDEPSGPDQPVYTNTIYLTPELDVVQGTDQNDHIVGQEFDGVNTLQSGDRIDGGAGKDLLTADVTAGSTFGQTINTVRPEVKNVEKIKFTSQQSTDEYHEDAAAIAEIRADRIGGMEELWSTDSRATLTVNDVRINSNQMLVGWQNADNADAANNNMDYVVRFNNQNLKANDAATSGTLVLNLIDTTGAMDGSPLLDNAYDGFRFYHNGTLISLTLERVSGADATYEDLLAAFQKALAGNPAAAGVTASLGGTFDNYDGNTGTMVQGTSIVLHANSGALTVPESDAWTASAGLPPTNSLNARVDSENTEDCPLIQTDIALDNVGMVEWNDVDTCIPNDQQFGDNAGDMVVGGMGTGNYVGVQRFDAVVDRGSWLSSLQSTNDALRMITVKNADLDDEDTKVGTSEADKGNLFIGDGQRLTNEAIRGGSLMFEGRDGMLADAAYIRNHHSHYERDMSSETGVAGQTVASGIVDVMNFDASAMTGKANISAAITDFASRKYLSASDQVDGLGNKFAPGTNFDYKFGSNDDTLNMKFNGNVAADNDVKWSIDMGDGNNSVHTEFTDLGTTGGKNNWMHNQWALNNAVIATGSGDDIINPWGTGRMVVNAGAGNDVVYADNSGIIAPDVNNVDGVGAIYVLNSASDAQSRAVEVVKGEIVPYRNDILSDQAFNHDFGFSNLTLASGNTVRVTVTVTYKGVASQQTLDLRVTPDAGNTTGHVSVNTAEVNQLIADAVNSDGSHLHSLMSAQEGAGHSLMLISKVDGVQTINDLNISFNAQQIPGANNQPVSIDGLKTDLTTWYNSDNKHFATKVDESDPTQTTQIKFVAVDGNNSVASSDNTINLGAGNDLAVLGTGGTSNDVVVLNNADNGHDTIVNFDTRVGTDGVDMLNTGQIFGSGGSITVVPASRTVGGVGAANPDAGIVNGKDANHIAHNISYVQNDKSDQANYISSPESLLARIQADNNVPQHNVTLFMVYDNGGSAATFTMYRAEFGAQGATPQISALGSITFADFITSSGANSSTLADYLENASEIGTMVGGTQQKNNAPDQDGDRVVVSEDGVSGTLTDANAAFDAQGSDNFDASGLLVVNPDATITINNLGQGATVTLGDTGKKASVEANAGATVNMTKADTAAEVDNTQKAGPVDLNMQAEGQTATVNTAGGDVTLNMLAGGQKATVDAAGDTTGAKYDVDQIAVGSKADITIGANNGVADTIEIAATPASTSKAAGDNGAPYAFVEIANFEAGKDKLVLTDTDAGHTNISVSGDVLVAWFDKVGISLVEANIAMQANGKVFTDGANAYAVVGSTDGTSATLVQLTGVTTEVNIELGQDEAPAA